MPARPHRRALFWGLPVGDDVTSGVRALPGGEKKKNVECEDIGVNLWTSH